MFSIHQISHKNINPIASIIGTSFCSDEPTAKHIGLNPLDFAEWSGKVIGDCIDDHMSFFAKDENDGRILGCIICSRYDERKKLPEYKEAKPIFDFIDQLNLSLPESIRKEDTLYIHLAATGRNNSKRGICYSLSTYALKRAKQAGYRFAYVELTAPGTQHIFLNKLKFRELDVIDYSSYGREFLGCQGKCVLACINLEQYNDQ